MRWSLSLRTRIVLLKPTPPPPHGPLRPAQEPTPRWTLTWLEGRPIAELDTGVIVTLDDDGEAVVHHDPDDEFA